MLNDLVYKNFIDSGLQVGKLWSKVHYIYSLPWLQSAEFSSQYNWLTQALFKILILYFEQIQMPQELDQHVQLCNTIVVGW